MHRNLAQRVRSGLLDGQPAQAELSRADRIRSEAKSIGSVAGSFKSGVFAAVGAVALARWAGLG
jgi:hypothetical protein